MRRLDGDDDSGSLRLGVLVPCRNEARVVERKLRNLGRAAWPSGSHRIVVIDDGSTDDTAAIARRVAGCVFEEGPVDVRVVANHGPPGKSGAVATGIGELGDAYDLIVLTDADVVVEEDALVELARAFHRDEDLVLACGAQAFVQDLAADGRPQSASNGPPVRADGLYDRVTALVRRLESSIGRVFSVHGQLCAWRASFGLVPTTGRPADDLDLMFAARRARPGKARVRLVAGVRFLEIKTGDPGQAHRRARAYFEALRGRRWPLGESFLDRLQWLFYRYVPAAAPEGFVGFVFASLLTAFLLGGGRLAALLFALLALILVSSPGRRLLRLLTVIRAARRSETRAPLSDRWEMQRT